MTNKPKVTESPGQECHQEAGWLWNMIGCYLADGYHDVLEDAVESFVVTQGREAIGWVLSEIEWLEAHKATPKGNQVWEWAFSHFPYQMTDEEGLAKIKAKLLELKGAKPTSTPEGRQRAPEGPSEAAQKKRWWWPF